MRTDLMGVLMLGATLALGGCGQSGMAGGGGGEVQLIHDAAAGQPYALPGPRKCSTKKVPGDGPPSPEVIAAYVICGGEGKSGENMYVLDQVQVTGVAPGRPYNPNEDINMSNIDINKPVYAIRGSLDSYQCAQVQAPGGYDFGPGYHAGTNCGYTHSPNASGLCYQDTFGDWSCSMVDTSAEINSRRNVAPPAA